MPAAFYSFSAQVISRCNGVGSSRSVVAAAAYRSGEALDFAQEGITFDYRVKSHILAKGILTPPLSPAWTKDRASLWNMVERQEKRKDAQLARELRVCFPDQFSEEQRAEILERFMMRYCVDHGMIADWAIHAPNGKGDVRNHHAHILLTLREIAPEGFSAKKQREWNKPEWLKRWREGWAREVNKAFAVYGIRDLATGELWEVDHRSYEDRGQDLEATYHLGPHATAMERRGILTEIGSSNRAIVERNAERVSLREFAGRELDAATQRTYQERQYPNRQQKRGYDFER